MEERGRSTENAWHRLEADGTARKLAATIARFMVPQRVSRDSRLEPRPMEGSRPHKTVWSVNSHTHTREGSWLMSPLVGAVHSTRHRRRTPSRSRCAMFRETSFGHVCRSGTRVRHGGGCRIQTQLPQLLGRFDTIYSTAATQIQVTAAGPRAHPVSTAWPLNDRDHASCSLLNPFQEILVNLVTQWFRFTQQSM